MGINGIGGKDVDYSRSSRLIEQQKDGAEQQVKQSATTQQVKKSDASAASKISASSSKTSDDEDSDQALINKAKAGSALTQSEMSRLKEVDPALYARLQAREELRNQSKYDQFELSTVAVRMSKEQTTAKTE